MLRIGFLVIVLSLLAAGQTDAMPQVQSRSGSAQQSSQASIGQWERYEISYPNSSWDGNPFDLEFAGVFTHVSSGRTMTQLGFYAGDDTWKIYFMPDAIGQWTFETVSTDPELDGKQGTFEAVESSLPGPLVGEGNRWKLKDSGEYVAPIMLPSREWFKSTETNDGVGDFITWADETAGALIIGTTLVYFGHDQAASPYVKEQEGELFNIPMWDRLNSHLDMLRDRDLGFYIMFYSDDSEAPDRWGIGEQSAEELRLLRYAVARFSAYPIMMWDTGIDISETRSSGWIDWFADWFNEHDPWQHPVGSRFGGGSGGHHPENGTFISDGSSNLPRHTNVVSAWQNCSLPRAYTDRWREDYGRGNFNRDKIRRAAWEVGLVGGTAVYISGNETDGYLSQNYANDLKAAPDLGYRTHFIRSEIKHFRLLSPHPELVTRGSDVVLVANPGQEYVAYSSSGGTVGVDLSSTLNSFTVRWYNPRTGQMHGQGTVTGGSDRSFSAPFAGDAVLHLYSSDPPDTPFKNYLPSVAHGNRSRAPVQETATLDCGNLGSAGSSSSRVQRWVEAGTIALGSNSLSRVLIVGSIVLAVAIWVLYTVRPDRQH